jgi:hypothetical protein
MVKPAAPAPAPTIDVIDEPSTSAAMGQMAKSLSEPRKSSALDQTAQSLVSPPAVEPIMNPDSALPTRLSQPAPDAEETPDNVFQFPNRLSRADTAPDDADQPDLFDTPPRTGTYNESQELRRMRELAGLPITEADSFYTPPEPGVFTIRVDGMFINDYWPGYKPENPEILWNGLSAAFPRDYPRVAFGTPNTPQATVFARLKDRNFADVKTGLTQDMADTLAAKLAKGDPTGKFSRWIQVIQTRS